MIYYSALCTPVWGESLGGYQGTHAVPVADGLRKCSHLHLWHCMTRSGQKQDNLDVHMSVGKRLMWRAGDLGRSTVEQLNAGCLLLTSCSPCDCCYIRVRFPSIVNCVVYNIIERSSRQWDNCTVLQELARVTGFNTSYGETKLLYLSTRMAVLHTAVQIPDLVLHAPSFMGKYQVAMKPT